VTPYVEAKPARPTICALVSATKSSAGVSRNAVQQFSVKSGQLKANFVKIDSMAAVDTFLGGVNEFQPLFTTTFNCLGAIWYRRPEDIRSFVKIVRVKTALYLSA
jgi:hypothetical protein